MILISYYLNRLVAEPWFIEKCSVTARELLGNCSGTALKLLLNVQMKTRLMFVFFIVPFVGRFILASLSRFSVEK